MQVRTLWVSVFLLTFGVFVQHMTLSGYLRDSGELTAAAALLGVPHETGFPLFCLLGQALRLLPLGEAASRLALLSALCGAAGCGAAAVLTARLLASETTAAAMIEARSRAARLGGACAGLLLACGATYFKAAAVPEVYAPTAAALGLGLCLLERAEGAPDPATRARAGLALGLTLGLGLGLHASLRLLLVPLAGLLGLRALARKERWPLPAAALFVLGAAILAYLPIRAARETMTTWGEAHTLRGLLAHLGAARIRDSFRDEILTSDLRRLAHHLRAFVAQVGGQLGPAAALGALGLVALLRRRRALALALLAITAGDVLYSAWINPMGMLDLQDGVPCAMALCVGAGVLVGLLAERTPPRLRALPLGLAAAALLPAALADRESKVGLESGLALRWSRGALDQLPPRGLLLPRSDDLSATLLYEQAVAGDRPDVTVLVRQLAWDGAYLRRMAGRGDRRWLPPGEAAAFAALPEAERVLRAPALLDALVAVAPARVAWEPGPEDRAPAAQRLGVPLFPLEPGPPGPPAADLAAGPAPQLARLAALLEGEAGLPADPIARTLGGRAALRLAEVYLPLPDGRTAAALLELALRLDPTLTAAEIAAGVLRARQGDLRGALAAMERVLARDPDQATAHLNAARYRLRLGDRDGARRHAQEVLRLRPGHAAATALLAR